MSWQTTRPLLKVLGIILLAELCASLLLNTLTPKGTWWPQQLILFAYIDLAYLAVCAMLVSRSRKN